MIGTILIVEDSDDDFSDITRVFKKARLLNTVHRCSSGCRALDYLYQRAEFSIPGCAPKPDLILLDLNLPGTDGREVLRVVKSDPQFSQTPVVVLTTSYERKDITQSYETGADSYLQKPVNFVGFVEALARLRSYGFGLAVLPKELQCPIQS